MMMMNIGMYGMCNTTDSFSSYHPLGATNNHHSNQLHHHGASVIHRYNSPSDMAPTYSTATATTPPEHQFHHHGTPYYTSSVDTYSSSTAANNQGLHNSDTCSSDRTTSPNQTNENSATYYASNSSGLHQHHQDASVVQQQHEENVIINSDNGLSYTNLDYGTPTSQSYHHNPMTPPGHPSEHHPVIYPPTNINYASKSHHHEEMMHQGGHQHDEILPHHVNHHHHHQINQQDGYLTGNYMHHSVSSPDTNEAAQYSPVMAQHHHQSPSPLSSDYPGLHRHYKEESCHTLLSEMHQVHSGAAVSSGNGAVMMATPGATGSFHHHPLHPHMHQNAGHHHHHHHLVQQQQQHHQQQQQSTTALPTYKWMQVKRNVPKPAGKIFHKYYLV